VAAERGHRVQLHEAGPEMGGQFRLAGLQPRRAQILDLLGWYARQLARLGVEVRFNSYLDAGEIAAIGADHVILATGSLPAGTGFQKAIPHLSALPGLDGNVWPVEDVMGRAARLGPRVIVLDEGGNWRGGGTAWHLAEAGHQVVIVTPQAMVGRELERSAADVPLRRRLAALGVRFVTESAITSWQNGGAEVVDLLTGARSHVAADSLVLATTNRADVSLRDELAAQGVVARLIGDAHAPRLAAQAFHDGRKMALVL